MTAPELGEIKPDISDKVRSVCETFVRAVKAGEDTAEVVAALAARECERLQGFPDDYTLVPYRGKPAADGPRYRALGNSMARPVMRWIGDRIALVDAIKAESLAA